MPGVNSGQTSITYCDLAYYVETTAVRKLKGFDHETGSQISFPNFTFRHEFFLYQLSEGLKIRKILADGVWMQKNRQTRGNIF